MATMAASNLEESERPLVQMGVTLRSATCSVPIQKNWLKESSRGHTMLASIRAVANS